MEWIVEAETIEDLVDGPMMISKKIVRCRDCKWWMAHPKWQAEIGYCKDIYVAKKADDYCSCGERKEAESE